MDIKLDINKVLADIAEGLGVAVEKIYPILYKQALIDGFVNLFWVALIIIASVVYFKFVKFAIKRIHKGIKDNEKYTYSKTDWTDYPEYILTTVFGGVAILLFLLVGMTLIEDSITAFFNTDYYIINEIVNKIRSN